MYVILFSEHDLLILDCKTFYFKKHLNLCKIFRLCPIHAYCTVKYLSFNLVIVTVSSASRIVLDKRLDFWWWSPLIPILHATYWENYGEISLTPLYMGAGVTPSSSLVSSHLVQTVCRVSGVAAASVPTCGAGARSQCENQPSLHHRWQIRATTFTIIPSNSGKNADSCMTLRCRDHSHSIAAIYKKFDSLILKLIIF